MGRVAQITNISSLQLSSLTVQDQNFNRSVSEWGHFLVHWQPQYIIVFTWSEGASPQGLLLRALIPFMRALLSWLNHLPEASSPITNDVSVNINSGDTFKSITGTDYVPVTVLAVSDQGLNNRSLCLGGTYFQWHRNMKHIKDVNDMILKLFCAVLTCGSQVLLKQESLAM